MPRLRVLSGADVVSALGRFGFTRLSRRGDHVKLRRVLPDGRRQNLTVPLHDELDRGTTMAIYRQAARFISESDLRPIFYTD